MGIIDIVLLIIICIVAIKGLIKGLVMEIFGLIALIAGYVCGYKYSHVFAKPVGSLGLEEKSADAIGYVVAFVIAYIVVILIGSVLSKAFKEIKLGSVNRGGGFVFGGFKAVVILGLVLSTLITVLPKDSAFSKNLQGGMISGKIAKVAPFVYGVMNNIPDVKKINPFDMPKKYKPTDAMDLLESDAVQDALKSLGDTKAGGELQGLSQESQDAIKEIFKDEPPVENPLENMQKE